MRGENVPVNCSIIFSGTSPHAWGKPVGLEGHVVDGRNIPTCVGKTLVRRWLRSANPEHPHMRGENWRAGVSSDMKDGTSPHAWGKRCPTCPPSSTRRNIPTCVGKTRWYFFYSGSPSEHPHMRGENLNAQSGSFPERGTSPHAWGKHDWFARDCFHFRNIPTCVGKTKRFPDSRCPFPEHPHMRGENPPGAMAT